MFEQEDGNDMGPVTAISTALVKTFSYSGRASRSEYWWYFLLYTLACLICGFIDAAMIISAIERQGQDALATLSVFDFKSIYVSIALIPPMISLTVRRLHDAGFSGFWALIYVVPLGALALMVLHMLPSKNTTRVRKAPAVQPKTNLPGKPLQADAHKRAMQGYALLFDKDKRPCAETQAARKAEMADYYRRQVLKSAPSA
jgi:uncharacterized membrane protein YhaH (DUF805 family)